MPQRRPPALFVPHDHATQEVYGVAEDEAPYSGSRSLAVRVEPALIPLPSKVDDLGATRDTLNPHPVPLPPGEGRKDGGVAYSAAAVERARDVALVGREGVSMEGLLRVPAQAGELPHPPGFYYSVISEGFGVMPAYGAQLQPRERWAIVAYLRALGRSQRAPLSSAPPDIQTRLLQEGRAP
jgi:hypothetical protein